MLRDPSGARVAGSQLALESQSSTPRRPWRRQAKARRRSSGSGAPTRVASCHALRATSPAKPGIAGELTQGSPCALGLSAQAAKLGPSPAGWACPGSERAYTKVIALGAGGWGTALGLEREGPNARTQSCETGWGLGLHGQHTPGRSCATPPRALVSVLRARRAGHSALQGLCWAAADRPSLGIAGSGSWRIAGRSQLRPGRRVFGSPTQTALAALGPGVGPAASLRWARLLNAWTQGF